MNPFGWIAGFAVQKVVSPRLKPPAVTVGTRVVADPRVVRVPTRHGTVTCFVYDAHPDAPRATGGPSPVHLHLHGGGFIMRNPRQDDHLAKYIAGEVGATVVSVDYDVTPQVRFPVAEEQCFDVLAWMADSSNHHPWDTDRISVSGISAGGHLAFSALRLAHLHGGPTVRAAVAIVPFVDATLPVKSYTSPLSRPRIGRATIRVIRGTYFVDSSTRSTPLASPAYDTDLAGYLPPLHVQSAADDSLVPQIDRFVDRLKAEGADVTYRRFDGEDHDYIALDTTSDAVMDESLALIRDHLMQHLR